MSTNLLLRPAIGTCLILAVPLVMTILDRDKPMGKGWHWNPGAFVAFGLLLLAAGVLFEWILRRTPRVAYRLAAAGAIALAVLALWAELAAEAVSRSLSFVFG